MLVLGLTARYRNLYTQSVKTTLNINDQLLADAKVLAAQRRTSLTKLIEEGLQLRLRAAATLRITRKTQVPAIPIYRGKGGLVMGVNPSSNRALLEAMESEAGLK